MITALHEIVYSDDDCDTGVLQNGLPMDFGRGIVLRVPGADDMLLYQPYHATAYDRG